MLRAAYLPYHAVALDPRGLTSHVRFKAKGHGFGDRAHTPWVVYAALAVTQVCHSFGAAYLKVSLRGSSEPLRPVIFCLFRESLACVVLLGVSAWKTGLVLPPRADVFPFVRLGMFLFLSHLLFLWGLSLSGVTMASCMQPSIPVITIGLTMALGMERGTARKLAGTAVAVAGALCMVTGGGFGGHLQQGDSSFYGYSGTNLLGNLCLFANCLCSACFLISVKQMVLRYHSSNITAWSYMFAAILLALTSAATVPWEHWSIPREATGPLVWWVVVVSVIGYCTITWATSVVPASQVSASICLQPFAGTLLGWFLLGEPLGWWDLGALGILLGLCLNISDTSEHEKVSAKCTAICEQGVEHSARIHSKAELLPLLRTRSGNIPNSAPCGVPVRSANTHNLSYDRLQTIFHSSNDSL